jgi:uncharacterized protein with von Willebrand factor type A (vWA) domain
MRVAYASTLEANLLKFGRMLRAQGFMVSAFEVGLGLKALELIDLSDLKAVHLSLRTVFAKSPTEQRRFDRLFEKFWSGDLASSEKFSSNEHPTQVPKEAPQGLSVLDWMENREPEEQADTMGYSSSEVMSAQDFAEIETGQIETLQRLVAAFSKRLATRLSRRYRYSHRRGERLDFRRTLRHSLSSGGEPIVLFKRKRKREKTRLVFLFDVSGSMMIYSQFLLQLSYAFVRQRSIGRTEVFGFSTDLYRLTNTLQLLGVEDAMRAALVAMPGHSGGTKVGASLTRFLERYGGTLDPSTVVIIASDGWDTGDLEVLSTAMKTIKRRSAKVVWLNPLAASPGYLPTAAGMKTAFPFIDVFAPAHNLESLRTLESHLTGFR